MRSGGEGGGSSIPVCHGWESTEALGPEGWHARSSGASGIHATLLVSGRKRLCCRCCVCPVGMSWETRSIPFQEFSVVWWWKCKNEISGGIPEGCVQVCVSGSMCESFTCLLLLGLWHFCPCKFVHVMVSMCARSWACLHLISLSSWIYVLYMFAAPLTVIRHPRAPQERWYFLSELLRGSGWNELKE